MTRPLPDQPPPDFSQSDPSAPPDEKHGSHRAISVGQILAGLLFVVVIIFVAENTRKVKVRLIVPEVTTNLFVPILIAAVLGALIAALMRFRRQSRARRRDRTRTSGQR
jgi:uncharacterized integral membrane protein